MSKNVPFSNLKTKLQNEHPLKPPSKDQKIICGGKLAKNDQNLMEFLNDSLVVHLVCPNLECKKPKRLVSKESNSEKPKVSATDDNSEIIKEILYQNYLVQQNRTRQRILDIISFMKFKGLERHPIYRVFF